MTKVNLGCGYNKIEGFINCDKYEETGADLLFDLDLPYWPIENDSVDEVVANHVLEHVKDFKVVMREIYRICQDGALFHITVPHVRNDNFLSDPTHHTRILPDTMTLLSKKNNAHWKAVGAANSPLADFWGVDFEFQTIQAADGSARANIQYVIDPRFAQWEKDPGIERMIVTQNNVIAEIKMTMIVRKESK